MTRCFQLCSSGTARVVATLLAVICISGSAAAQTCQGSAGVDIDRLYQYSQFAQVAYGETPDNACQHTRLQRSAADALQETRVVPLTRDVAERLDLDLPGNPRIAVYEGDDGVHYVTCRRDELVPVLAISWYLTFRPRVEPVDLIVLLQVVRLVQNRGGALTEELGLVRRDRGGTAPERLLAIRGTDPRRWPQLMATVMDLLDRSCVFEVAAEVVAREENRWTGRVSVVGHSLGGSATQFVARHRSTKSAALPATGGFRAYSFNGIGLAGSAANLRRLHSYYVDGEWVVELGRVFGRSQAGNVVRYIPSAGWPPVSTAESYRRHKLSTVQESLCECAKGRGRMEYQPSGSRR